MKGSATMTDINKEYEKEYYDEYRNRYYNPDDDDAEPGINLNWKRIQKGFKNVEGTDTATGEAIATMQESINTLETDVAKLKTDVENIDEKLEDIDSAVAVAESAAESASESAATAEQVAESIPADYSELSEDVTRLQGAMDGYKIEIDKTIEWIDGYVDIYGSIKTSTASKTGLVHMLAGEAVTVGTQNTNIAIISSTTADTIAVGDTVTMIQRTSGVNQYEEYSYTALQDINLVVCVLKSNYNIAFYKDTAITALKTETNGIQIELTQEFWETGSFEGRNIPQVNANNNRLRLKDFIFLPKGVSVTITPNNGQQWEYGQWTHNNNTWAITHNPASLAKVPKVIDISEDSYFTFIVAKPDSTASITPSDLDTVITISRVIRNYNEINGILNHFGLPNRSFNALSESGHVVSHRGMPYPENTYIAFQETIKHGTKIMEMDVAFTADNVAVLLHDTTINRTGRNADGTAISGTINIADITYQQALEYDFGIWCGQEYGGEKIPRLVDVLLLLRQTNTSAILDLTGHTYTTAQLGIIHDILTTLAMEKACALNAGFNLYGQYGFFDTVYNPSNSLRTLTEAKMYHDSCHNFTPMLIVSAVLSDIANPDFDYFTEMTKLGCKTCVGYATTVEEIKGLFNKGVDFVYSETIFESDITDYPM